MSVYRTVGPLVFLFYILIPVLTMYFGHYHLIFASVYVDPWHFKDIDSSQRTRLHVFVSRNAYDTEDLTRVVISYEIN